MVYSLALLAILAGCGEPPSVDTSLLTGEPCEPPCWQGLTPGVSTEEEVNEFVRTSELVDRTTLFRGDITRGTGEVVGVSVQWWSRADTAGVPRQFGNSFSIKDGILQYMTIFLDVEVTVEDLLERYGPPDKFSAYMVGAHPAWVELTLYYPEYGFMSELIIPPDDVRLTPEREVLYVWYFRAAPLEEFLEMSRDIGHPTVSDDVLQDWQGYGPMELIP
ncbi:MAG: hypothetical protein GTO63_06635 [Anaerolineae bacterium]|nr:hypothetical protein [Anaerolineae bacterium]NIN94649.1 hypothetical protein [Anaerolineae bacterium]NIQ77709.1 hypothetical protein [Anaerolineae bacterium]